MEIICLTIIHPKSFTMINLHYDAFSLNGRRKGHTFFVHVAYRMLKKLSLGEKGFAFAFELINFFFLSPGISS